MNQTPPWEFGDYYHGLLNGSEEMVVELATALARRGNQVGVVGSFRFRAVCQNVDIYTQVPTITRNTTLIAFKNKDALKLPGFHKKYLWTADNELLGDLSKECDGLYGISPWHEEELRHANRLDVGLHIGHLEPGIHRYRRDDIRKKPFKCLYASSPDRGLDTLLGMWPRIYGVYPQAELHVTYARDRGMAYNGVTFHGRVSNDGMENLYKESDLLLYPCNGGERYCLTAIKAQYFGCIPVVIPTMALRDTVQFGAKCNRMNFESEVKRVLGDEQLKNRLRREMFANLRYNTWDDVAKFWESLAFEGTSGS